MSSRRPLTGRRDPRRLLPQEGFVPLPALTGGQRRPLQPAPAERRLPAAPNLGEGPLDLVDPPVEGAVPVVRVLLQVLGLLSLQPFLWLDGVQRPRELVQIVADADELAERGGKLRVVRRGGRRPVAAEALAYRLGGERRQRFV